MKNLIVLLLTIASIVFGTNFSNAQFISNGNPNGDMYNSSPNTSKVGIGTINPNAKLDVVNGFTHMTYNTSLLPPSESAGGLTVGWNRSAGGAEVNFYNVYNDAPIAFQFTQKSASVKQKYDLMTILGNGRTGIGTTTPGYKLHINGAGPNGEVAAFDQDANSNSTLFLAGATPGAYNPLTTVKDNGIIWHNGSSNPSNGFVIAPWATSANGIRIDGATGNVGLGVSTAIQKLDVNGRIHVADGVIQRGGAAITGTSDLGLYSLDQSFWLRFVTNDAPIKFFSDGGTDPIGGTANMTINPDGKVAIGTLNTPATINTSSTSAFKLFVEGGILTEEVIVATGWADYVFDYGYKLLSLEEVETHIQSNGHLPNTPSAREIEENGLAVGAMTVNQQEKIEELFLHLIEMHKRIKALETENQSLKGALKN